MRGNSGYQRGPDVSMSFVFTGPIVVGDFLDLAVDWGTEIVGWSLMADQEGDIEIDVRAGSAAAGEWPPDAGDSICGGDEPAMSAVAARRGTPNPSDWRTSLRAGDMLRAVVTDVSDIEQCTLQLWCRR